MDPRWPPGRRRSWMEQTGLLLFVLLCPASGICPSRCECNDKALEASCRHSGLEVVPIQLNPEIHTLRLDHNRIANIHLTLSFYTRLTDLDLAHNKIRDLGAHNFEFQYSLLRLNLSFNAIKDLHKDAFKGLKQLMELDLQGNALEEISQPMAFRDLKNLKILNLSRNTILSISVGAFDYLSDLQRLLLRENQLLSVPEAGINTLDRLEELDLDRNLIQEVSLPRNLHSLQILRLRSNLIATLSNESFEHTSSLRHLDLSDNNLTLVPTAELAKLENLHILNLSCNLFEQLGPHAFRKLYKLREAYLDNIGTLRKVDSKLFLDNPSLEVVSLSGNRHLHHLPKLLFANKPLLKHVRVSENAFSTLDASDLPLDHLATLRIGNNPFECNCSLLWLWILKERQTPNNCSEGCLDLRAEKLQQITEEYSEEEVSGEEKEVVPQSYTAITNNHFLPVILDMDQVTCHLEGHARQLRDVPKAAFDCSSPWVLVLSATILLVLSAFLLGIIGFLIRVRLGRKTRNPVENFLNATKTYEDTHHTYYRYGPAESKTAASFTDPYKCMSNMYMIPPEQHTGSLRPGNGFGINGLNGVNGLAGSRHFVSEANIYQEPYVGPVHPPLQRPHVVYV